MMTRPLPQVNEALCTRCGLCVEACACPAVAMGERGPIFHCEEVSCPLCLEGVDCGCLCEEVCPTGAIQCAFEIVLDDSQKTGFA
ncbi:MAG: 4Fe-4S binding protein [Chloroflexi bacterium]|nr:4Fe-4S binding protein [Chloroflexota bacterium]